MSRVTVALAGGLALTLVAVVLVLAQSPQTIVRSNYGVVEREIINTVNGGTTICDADEYVPQGTTEIQPKLGANTGPRMEVTVLSGPHIATSGARGSGWSGRIVTIPVKPLHQAIQDATICVSFQMHNETISIYGSPSPRRTGTEVGGKTLPETMWINYLRPSGQSWASRLGAIAQHFEFGRTTTGAWVVVLSLALVASVIGIASGLALKELR